MEIGNLVKYEDCSGIQFGIVLYADTDRYQDTVYGIKWDDNTVTLEYPDNLYIKVVQ